MKVYVCTIHDCQYGDDFTLGAASTVDIAKDKAREYIDDQAHQSVRLFDYEKPIGLHVEILYYCLDDEKNYTVTIEEFEVDKFYW